MKRRLAILLAILFLLTSCVNGAEEPEAPPEEKAALYMLDVGKGDAILITCGERAYLVDTAKKTRFDRVEEALDELGIDYLDGVFLTHTDNDHSGGLMPLAKSEIGVGTWYASAFFSDPDKEKSHPAVKAAKKRGQEVVFLRAGDTVDGLFHVLAPEQAFEEEDDNSLVMRLTLNGVPILLTGDMDEREEQLLRNSGQDFSCKVLKVPHHGKEDCCSWSFMLETGAKIALISTEPEEKPGSPDETILEELQDAGMEVFITYETEYGVGVRFSHGEAEVFPIEITE